MKKLLGIGLILGCMSVCNSAQAVTLQEILGLNQGSQSIVHYQALNQRYINDMGVKILNANAIDKHIIFGLDTPMNYTFWGVKDDVTDSHRTLFMNRKVVISSTLLNNATSDDEVAALMSHEIAHCLKSYTGILRGSFHGLVYTFTAKKQNYDADITAVNLMAKAGYNPVALITILDKTAGQYRFDIGENGLTTKRIRKVYEYIRSEYPQYLAAYSSNPYFKNAMNIIKPSETDRNFKYYADKAKKKK